MCIKIFKSDQPISYDMSRPLEEQIQGSKKIVVDYDPKDESVDKFLDEVERLCKHGISASLNIKFNHNNNLSGARIRKQLDQLSEDLDVNELIKMLSLTYADVDKKLEELHKYCKIGNFNE